MAEKKSKWSQLCVVSNKKKPPDQSFHGWSEW